MLSESSFWRGSDKEDRRVTYKAEYEARKTELEHNAAEVMSRINAAATAFTEATGITLPGRYTSGWRPAKVNAATKGAAPHSNHMDANAGDVEDTPHGAFAWWCMAHPHVLESLGLWMEHPAGTVLMAQASPWCHLQRLPPKSADVRCYFPTNAAYAVWADYVKKGGQPSGGPLALRSKPVADDEPANA